MWARKAANTSCGVHKASWRRARASPSLGSFRPRREQRVLRDHSQLLLPREGLLADHIPALIELALELVDPFFGDMQRRVRGAGGEIDEVRLVRRERLLAVDPGNGVVNQVFGQVIALLGRLGGSTANSLRNSCGSHWLVSPPWKPYQYSNPRPVGQCWNGPMGDVSQSGVLCHLPQAAVL